MMRHPKRKSRRRKGSPRKIINNRSHLANCQVCGKHLYETRQQAKNARQRFVEASHALLSIYKASDCGHPDLYHIGNLTGEVKRGERERPP